MESTHLIDTEANMSPVLTAIAASLPLENSVNPEEQPHLMRAEFQEKMLLEKGPMGLWLSTKTPEYLPSWHFEDGRYLVQAKNGKEGLKFDPEKPILLKSLITLRGDGQQPPPHIPSLADIVSYKDRDAATQLLHMIITDAQALATELAMAAHGKNAWTLLFINVDRRLQSITSGEGVEWHQRDTKQQQKQLHIHALTGSKELRPIIAGVFPRHLAALERNHRGPVTEFVPDQEGINQLAEKLASPAGSFVIIGPNWMLGSETTTDAEQICGRVINPSPTVLQRSQAGILKQSITGFTTELYERYSATSAP